MCAAIGLGGPVARAADRPRPIELDVVGLRQEYASKGETRPFAEFVEAKYRKRRDTGRGLLFGGLGLGVVGTAMFFLALPRNDAAPVTYTSYGVLGVSVGMIIAGSVVWHRNFRRLEQLETSGLALGPRGRVRLQTAGPFALRRGAGVGFALAF